MDIDYVDILTGKICGKLNYWSVHSSIIQGEDMVKGKDRLLIFQPAEIITFHNIRIHENLMQNPSNMYRLNYCVLLFKKGMSISCCLMKKQQPVNVQIIALLCRLVYYQHTFFIINICPSVHLSVLHLKMSYKFSLQFFL